MSKTLPDAIASPQQVQILRLEIGRCIDLLNEAARRKQSGAVEISADLKSVLGASEVSQENLKKIDDLLAKASAWQVVHLQLPATPAPSLRAKLAGWFRDNIKHELLISFELNSNLAGGFAVRIGAKQFDHSFRSRLLQGSGAMEKVLAQVLQGKPNAGK